MGLSDADPITWVGFLFLMLLLMSVYNGQAPQDLAIVQGAALLVQLPVMLISSVSSSAWIFLPIALVIGLFYFEGIAGFLGEGLLAMMVVAWLIIMLA